MTDLADDFGAGRDERVRAEGHEPVDVRIVEGAESILARAELLERFAEACGQLGAMHWLGYFLGGRGAQWKRPCVVLFLQPGADGASLKLEDLRAAVLFYELRALGIGTGAFSTDDWEGLRTVIAPLSIRHQVTAMATEALMQRGAHVVLTTYRGMAFDERHAGPKLRRLGVLWAEEERQVAKQRMLLGDTYEETLAKFGKQTRIHLRYYRKRLLAEMDCEFLADALPVVSEEELVQMNLASLNPVSELECKRRYQATRDLKGGFLMALRDAKGQLLSIIGGWRQGTTTVMHHQMNAAGYEKRSLGTVMRAFLLESEVERGTRTLIFYHGTNHSMSHAFEVETTRDLVVLRRSVRAWALRKLAGFLASPRSYAETHYLGGSNTFFAAVLTSDTLDWQPISPGLASSG